MTSKAGLLRMLAASGKSPGGGSLPKGANSAGSPSAALYLGACWNCVDVWDWYGLASTGPIWRNFDARTGSEASALTAAKLWLVFEHCQLINANIPPSRTCRGPSLE